MSAQLQSVPISQRRRRTPLNHGLDLMRKVIEVIGIFSLVLGLFFVGYELRLNSDIVQLKHS